MARPKKQLDTVQAQEQKPKREYTRKLDKTDILDHVLEVETSNEKYFKYWMRFTGYDIREKLTSRIMTKGEFYRKYTELAEKMSDHKNELDNKFELVKKPLGAY